MTETDYIATPERTGHPFTFTRIRAGATKEFLPGEGSRLHFANRATDTLEVVGVPSGFLVAGDTVTVAYLGTLVFRGEVDTIVRNLSRGDDTTENVTCTGPWAKMARLVCKQNWMTGSNNVTASKASSRLILNQSASGSAQGLNTALTEIANGPNNGAPAACGYQVGTVSVSTQELPFDPTRDITIAQAIIRELKFFPAAVTRFDYSTTTPTLNITLPDLSGNDAAYVSQIPKTARQYVYNAHPVTAVALEIETVGEVDGAQYRDITHQVAPFGYDASTNNPDCLYATIQLAGFSASSVKQSFVSEVESIANWNGIDDPGFWKAKHPYLANVPLTQGSITITNAHRSGEDTSEGITDYPNISKNTVGEIQAAGLKARVETFTCTARIVRTGGLNSGVEEIEEGVQLQMQFVTTNATNRTYTWTDSSSSTSGETVPTGLAAALLSARSGALREERFTMRLGTVAQWPKLGDICDHLVLQEFDVDLTMLTAELHFGTPDYLSPDDMAALMTGFRNKARATFSTSRVSGKTADDAESTVDMGGVMPLSSTEFSPGTKSKTTFKSSASGTGTVAVNSSIASPVATLTSASAGSIEMDTSKIPNGSKMEAHSLKLKDGSTTVVDAKVLATDDYELLVKHIAGGVGINISESNDGSTITINNTAPCSCEGGGGGSSSEVDAFVGYDGNLVLASLPTYDSSSHQLKYTPVTLTFDNGRLVDAVSASSPTVITTAVEET